MVALLAMDSVWGVMRLLGGCISDWTTIPDEGGKASSTPVLSILSSCCVTGQFGSVVSWFEFGFVCHCYVYIVFLCELFWGLEVKPLM